MGEVLRPREGERRHRQTYGYVTSELSAITPERQPLATLTRNLLCSDRPCRFGRDPPVRRTGGVTGWGSSLRAGPARWGSKTCEAPNGCRAAGNGPSLADRGLSEGCAQGGALPVGNGQITARWPISIGQTHRVATAGGGNREPTGHPRRKRATAFTTSNSDCDYQVLVKHSR